MRRHALRNVVSVSLATLVLLLALGMSQAQDSQPVFRIGVLDDMRGPISNGARLAVREINEGGGVTSADGTVFRLELVIESTPPGNTLDEAIQRIDQASVIAVLGPETTEDVLGNLPLLQGLEVPILTPAIGDTVIASDATQSFFRIRAAERLQGAALADYLVSQLNARQIITAQLDPISTAGRVGFSIALSQQDNPPQESTLIFDEEGGIAALVTDVADSNPQVVVAYGPPALTAQFYTQLRDAGWVGIFAYNQVKSPDFNENVPISELQGILGTTTWSLDTPTNRSMTFLDNYIDAYSEVPGPIEAAGYDAIYLLAEAVSRAGDLRSNLSNVRDVQGVQGVLNRTGLTRGEMSDTVALIQLNALGGPDLLARYSSRERLEPGEEVVTRPTNTPAPTATPEGVFITIRSSVQNVRTGPGLEYPVLGQLRQGETARVIGASVDFNWVVIDFRGQQGWLATYLLDVSGDRSTVQVIQAPPTPTPPPATATPTPQPFADIVVTSASPSTIPQNVTTNVNVTVRNQGPVNAGPFAVAATFPPDSQYTAVNLEGLAAGAEVVVQLPVTLTGATGNYQVSIISDLNGQVNEGPAGEANNQFLFNYKLDRQLIVISSAALASGASLDLEGNVTPQNDIQYTGTGLNTTGSCTGSANCIGLLSPALNWDTAHFGAVTSGNGINTTFIDNAALQPGTTIGIFTAEGRRGVIRVDSIAPGSSINITYRVYQSP